MVGGVGMTFDTTELPYAVVKVNGTTIALTLDCVGQMEDIRGGVEVVVSVPVVLRVRGESLTDVISWCEGIIEKCEALDADLAPNSALPF
jgi:hypothetical protein